MRLYKQVFDGMGSLSLIPDTKQIKFETCTPAQRLEKSFGSVGRSFVRTGNSIRWTIQNEINKN